jgi:hypothetical protein
MFNETVVTGNETCVVMFSKEKRTLSCMQHGYIKKCTFMVILRHLKLNFVGSRQRDGKRVLAILLHQCDALGPVYTDTK